MAQLYWPFSRDVVSEWCGGYSDVRTGIHMGTDFAVGQGTELRATMDGVIRTYSGNGGNGIDIVADDGIVVRNWHLSAFLVSAGERVSAGQVIGLTGGAAGTWGAGNSTGPHLHWEIRDNIRFNDIGWIDPRDLNVLDFGQEAAAAAPAAEPANNVVRPGDGYWHIAQRVWGGDNDTIEANMNKLIELNGGKRLYAGDTVILDAPAPPPAPEPTPEPVPAPVEEAPKPVEPERKKPIIKPTPKPTPKKKEPILSKKEEQAALAALPQISLGVIIPTVKARKIAYITFAVIALVVGNIGVAFAAAGDGWPVWLVVAVAVVNNLTPLFSTIAVANLPKDE